MTREYLERQLELDSLSGIDAHRVFLRQELLVAVPSGWTVNDRLHGWRIDCAPTETFPGSLCFIVRFSLETKQIVVLHGNTDAAPKGARELLQRATAIELSAHALVPLRELFAQLFRTEAPNRYGFA